MAMKIGILRAVLRTWRALKNARMAFFNRLIARLMRGSNLPG
jgi:hypothetical protein